jgi:hypothetical protein
MGYINELCYDNRCHGLKGLQALRNNIYDFVSFTTSPFRPLLMDNLLVV